MIFEIARSPVFNLVSNTFLGLTTLRAHQCQDVYQKMFDEGKTPIVQLTIYFLPLVVGFQLVLTVP